MCAHWSFVWARSSASMSIAGRFAISSFVAAVGGAASCPSSRLHQSSSPPSSSRPRPHAPGEPGGKGLSQRRPLHLTVCLRAHVCIPAATLPKVPFLPSAASSESVTGRHLVYLGFVVLRRASSSPLRRWLKCCEALQHPEPPAGCSCTLPRLSRGPLVRQLFRSGMLGHRIFEQGNKPCLQVWLHSSRLKHRGSSRSFQHRMRARCPLCAWVGHWWSVMWHSVQWSHSGSSQPLRPPTVSSPVSRPGHKFSRSEPPSCTLPSTTIRCTGGIGSTTGRLSWHKLVKAPRLSGRASCGYHIASAIFPNPWYCLTSLPSISSFCPSPASPSSISSSTSSSIRESSGPLRRLVPPAAY